MIRYNSAENLFSTQGEFNQQTHTLTLNIQFYSIWDSVGTIAISNDKQFVAITIQNRNRLDIWSLELKKVIKTIKSRFLLNRSSLILCEFSQDSNQFFFAQQKDDKIHIYDLKKNKIRDKIIQLERVIGIVRMSTNQKYFSINPYHKQTQCTIWLKDFKHSILLSDYQFNEESDFHMQFFNHDKLFFVGSTLQWQFIHYRILNFQQNKIVSKWKVGRKSVITQTTISKDQSLLFILFRSDEIKIYNLKSKKLVRTFNSIKLAEYRGILGTKMVAKMDKEKNFQILIFDMLTFKKFQWEHPLFQNNFQFNVLENGIVFFKYGFLDRNNLLIPLELIY